MRVFVTGASGFLGKNTVAALRDAGHEVVCLLRRPDPDNDNPVFIGDVTDSPGKLARGMQDCDAVVHLVGIIAEDRNAGQTFERVHVEGTQDVIEAAKQAGVDRNRFVYVSAIGANRNAKSEYSQTKAQAEEYVRASGIPYTIFRPSIILGPDAFFLQQIESLIQKPPLSPISLPFIPVPGDGQNRFQPVFVGDVTHCIAQCLTREDTAKQLYEIGGADEVTFDELITAVAERIGVQKPLFHAPMPAMFAAAAVLETVLPHPPVTTDQLTNLGLDNICDNTAVEQAFHFKALSFAETLARSYALRSRS